MRLRSGRIVEEQRVHPEEEETRSNEGSKEEVVNNNTNSTNDEDNDGASSTTMTDRQEEDNTPTRMNAEQIQQAVQIAIAAIQATQTATAGQTEETHRRLNGLKDAPRYNGKTDVRTWIRRYEAYAHAMGWNDAEQLDTLTVALEDSANEWLWSQERRDPEGEDTKDRLNRRKIDIVKRFGQTLVSHADYTQL
jgi:hypothetical protein